MRIGLLHFFLFCCATLHGQSPFLKVSLYFENDAYVLTEVHQQSLSAAVLDLKGKTITKVVIRGNTDANADSLYNIHLSDKRAHSVSAYLSEQDLSSNLFMVDHYGENKPIGDNSTEEGRRINRRVDVIFLYTEKSTSKEEIVVQEISTPDVNDEKDPCKRDTIVYVSGGAMLRLNVCEFQEKKECLDIKIVNTPEGIQEEGLQTYTNEHTPLESGGMVFFPTCEQGCFNKPAFIRMPVPCNDPQEMFLYTMDQNGDWKDPKNIVRVVRSEGTYYYEFPMPCNTPDKKESMEANQNKVNVDKPANETFATREKKIKRNNRPQRNFNLGNIGGTWCNLDKPMTNFSRLRYRTIIKAKEGLTLQRVELTSACPLGSYILPISRNGKRALMPRQMRRGFNREVRITAQDGDSTIVTGFRGIRSLSKASNNADAKPKSQKKYKVFRASFNKPEIPDYMRF